MVRLRTVVTMTVVALAVAAGCALAQTRSLLGSGRCDAPSVHVDKSDGVVELRCRGVARARFEATFGAEPVGPKLREGDERTPEGRYAVTSRVATPRFHRFLGLSYPNDDDRRRARAAGVARPGGGVGIHGVNRGRSWLARAWIRFAHGAGVHEAWGPTDGCIALTNDDVEYLYDAVRVGTPVEIVP